MKSVLKYLCPQTWFKKREIVFYGSYPHVDKTNPIIKSSDVKRGWEKKATDDFNKKLLEKNNIHAISGHRCLAINGIMKKGFVLKSDKEFAVETNGNDDDIKIHCNNIIIDIYGNHQNGEFSFFESDFLGNYARPKGSVKHIIKKQLPWNVTAPKDVVFLVLPFSYSNDNRFMATTGILDPVLATEINIVFWWLEKDSYQIIRKGTPLAQFIPIPRKSVCESWKMIDNVPEKIHNMRNALEKVAYSTKCRMYSEYKKVANEIYDTL